MNYYFVIGQNVILAGNVITGVVVVGLILVLLALVANGFWRKVRDTERMKYEFITIIAHKFRTPLTTTKWLLENMTVSETDSTVKENFTDLQKSNERLIALTGTLIELTNLEAENKTLYKLAKTSLCQFVAEVAENYKDMFHEKNIFLSLQCGDPDLIVWLDKQRMEFVLQTLLENAIAYTPTGRNVEVTVAREGRHGVVAVSDHGIGIAKEDIPRLFTKFFRAKNAQNVDTDGFGVGLFLAQSVVRRHKGKIKAYSAGLDQGSTFTLSLPRA